MRPDKLIKMRNGDSFEVTNDEVDRLMKCEQDLVRIMRLDVHINKKDIVSITKHWKSEYTYLN